jgi:hypothetical protein
MDVDGQANSSGSNGGSSDGSSDVVVVHIHFGMSGAFRTASLPGPDPTPTTRLRLVHEGTGLMAHLSAMTVAHGGVGLYREKVSVWGGGPLGCVGREKVFCKECDGSCGCACVSCIHVGVML